MRSVVQGRYQLAFRKSAIGEEDLFDVSVDPVAQRDIAAQHPGIVRKLREEAMRVMRGDEAATGGAGAAPDDETRRQLQALGYVDP